MSDLLLMDKINSLPHPLYVRLWGDDTRWPVADIDVETGMMRLDIVGKLQITFFSDACDLFDADGTRYSAADFYNEDTPQ